MGTHDLLRTERERIRQIAAKYGAHNVRVFGSFARGEATSESDLDLLVEFEPNRSLLDISGLKIELEELLKRKVDIVEPQALHWVIRDEVMEQAVPL